MRDIHYHLVAYLVLASMQFPLHAQSSASVPAPLPSSVADIHSVELERKLEAVSEALAVTHQQLEQTQQEMKQLREELIDIKKQLASTPLVPAEQSGSTNAAADAKTTAAAIENLKERLETTEAQIKVHDQTKIESSSKYPIRVTGLVLFNSFINLGVVDNLDLPGAALSTQANTTSNGSAGATLRQTILGLEGFGPRIAGARSSASVDMDFFGGLAYTSYASSAGTVRMRTASINLDWDHDSVQVGLMAPLISPLSPTSYATVAEPSLAGAGNLWTWAPQLRYSHQVRFDSGRRLQLEAGLWDPPTAGYSTNEIIRFPSPGEASKQPGYESRISYGTFTGERPFQIGVGGYYSRQSYPGNQSVDSWAVTTDWRTPISSHFELSGEGYRGRALGGLGGSVYKDVLFGTDPVSGLNYYEGLDAVGGWTQLKAHFSQSLEANAGIGLDNGFAEDFHAIILPPTASATQLRARNRMAFGNVIFRPKTYLILSPEYRRIWTWPIYGTRSTADIFTLSAGYQF
jgi:hypothetical protein